MAEVVIRSLGLAWLPPGTTDMTVGLYLMSFDVDAHGGRGAADFGPRAKAMRFPDAAAAAAAWKTQSKVDPIRPDGKPNRPLTAYSVELETIP